MTKEKMFLLKRIETKGAKDCAELLKRQAAKYGDEKGCGLYCLYNNDCNDDDILLNHYLKHTTLLDQEGFKLVKMFKDLVELERKSALAIYNNEDFIEVIGETVELN